MTREEASQWLKTHSLGRMRRSAAIKAGVLDLWTAFSTAKWDGDDEIRDDRSATAFALQVVYPRTSTIKGACQKCGGSKFIKAFAHIENGRCFACS